MDEREEIERKCQDFIRSLIIYYGDDSIDSIFEILDIVEDSTDIIKGQAYELMDLVAES